MQNFHPSKKEGAGNTGRRSRRSGETELFTSPVIALRTCAAYSLSRYLAKEDAMENRRAAQAGNHWSMDAFKAFWSNPDASKVSGALTEDVVGYWPRPIGVVRGASDYAGVIETILRVCPDFRLKVPEHAVSGDFTFVRWIATGTGPDGPFEFNGLRPRANTQWSCLRESYFLR
jgi:hypothetical protein